MKTELYESIQWAAQRCRDTRVAGTFLCDPLDDVDLLGQSSYFTPLLLWHVFDPLGPPVVISLNLIDVPKSDECLLVQRIILPLGSHARVYGLVPNQVALDRATLLAVISALFIRNGSDDLPIFRERPTAVHVTADGLLFKEHEQRELFRSAIEILGTEGLNQEISFYRRFRGDPWARTEAELRRPMSVFSLVGDEPVPDYEADTKFDVWWKIITAPSHVKSEAVALRTAWDNLRELHFSDSFDSEDLNYPESICWPGGPTSFS